MSGRAGRAALDEAEGSLHTKDGCSSTVLGLQELTEERRKGNTLS